MLGSSIGVNFRITPFKLEVSRARASGSRALNLLAVHRLAR